MLISCEKCSTTYVLDEALIPPQGAPVQCTRCGHVFTAKPAHAEPPAHAAGTSPWESPELQNKSPTSTLMFGGQSAPKPAPAPPQPSSSQTMVFGTPALGSGAPTPTPARGNQNQTMVFGTPGVGATPPPAAPPRNSQTMVFGTPAGTAPTPPPAASNANSRTMVFGTPAAVPPQATPAGPVPAKNQTMVFGAGARPSQPERPAQPPPNANPSQTLVFGANAGPRLNPPAGAENLKATQSTMMFGRPATKQGIPKVTPGAAEPAGYAGNEDDARLTESTVRVDLDSVEGPQDDSPEARRDRTQRYAMSEGGEGPAPGSVEDRHNRTVLFAMNPMQETTKPDALGPPIEPPPADPAVNQTLVFGARVAPGGPMTGPLEAVLATPPEGTGPVEQGAVATTLPNLKHITSGQHPSLQTLQVVESTTSPQPVLVPPTESSLDLPPESSLGQLAAEPVASSAEDEDVAALRKASSRRTTVAVVVFLALALALGLALAWYLFGRALVTKDSAAVQKQTDDALTLLRKDDLGSQRAAVAQLKAILAGHPDAVRAQAALVVALAVSADDARAELGRAERKLAFLKAELHDASEGSRDQLAAKVGQSEQQVATSRAAADAATRELNQDVGTLVALAGRQKLTPELEFDVARAKGLAAGVLGESDALALAERCRQLGHAPDNWADLVVPEYTANGGASFDEAMRQLELIEGRDNTFLRAYVLSARIHLLQKQAELAQDELARVLTFHPGHDAAKQLQEVALAQVPK